MRTATLSTSLPVDQFSTSVAPSSTVKIFHGHLIVSVPHSGCDSGQFDFGITSKLTLFFAFYFWICQISCRDPESVHPASRAFSPETEGTGWMLKRSSFTPLSPSQATAPCVLWVSSFYLQSVLFFSPLVLQCSSSAQAVELQASSILSDL